MKLDDQHVVNYLPFTGLDYSLCILLGWSKSGD